MPEKGGGARCRKTSFELENISTGKKAETTGRYGLFVNISAD